MQETYHGLILNNQLLPLDTLKIYCQEKVEDDLKPDWEKNIYKFILEWISEKDYINQTSSGTTGEKKEFRLPKKSMIESARKTCEFFDIKFGQTALLCLPVNYIAGKMMIVRAIVGGMNLMLTEPSSMPDLASCGKIDFCAMVPLQVYNSLNSVDTLRKINKLIIGGGEIRDELEVMLRDMPNEVFATYGMAETCSHIAIRRISGSEYERYYKAIPGVLLEADQRNCLRIKADFLQKPVTTNDVIDLLDEQTFRWIGRYDNLINSGGVKIVPEEVEAIVSKTSGLDCAVIGLPDVKLGARVVLVVEKGGSETSEDELRESLKTELPKHLQPREIIYIDELPRNHSFKVDRHKLKQQLKMQ